MTADMDLAKARLIKLTPSLHQICKNAGVASASIGILHQGRRLHDFNIGFSDVDKRIAPTTATIYGIGSLSKAFCSAVITQLIETGDLTLQTTIREVLPDFAPEDQNIRNNATVADMLTHTSGLSPSISIAFQGDGDILLDKSEVMSSVNNLETVSPLGTEWIYNSLGYSLIGELIERLTETPIDRAITDRLLAPLGMNRTSFHTNFSDSDDTISGPYSTLSDGTLFHLQKRMDFPGSVLEAAGGLFSCVDDMLIWGKVWLGHRVHGFCLPNLDSMLSGHAPIEPELPSPGERAYAPGGWIRTQLPNTLGLMGDNVYIHPASELPEIGHGATPELIYCHQGSTVGYFSQIILVPGSDSVIVVLTNSIALGDGADWLAQACLQALLGVPKPVDYVNWSERTAAKCVQKYDDMLSKLKAERVPGVPRALNAYEGTYTNSPGLFNIKVTRNQNISDASLMLAFQSKASQVYALRHLRDDIFEYSMDMDIAAKRGRFWEFATEIFKIEFVIEDGRVAGLRWPEDPDFKPEGALFSKCL